MNIDTGQISDRLIAYLREQLNNPGIEYASPLTRLQGGYETYTFRFRLKGMQDQYAQPLILRLYPKFYGPHNAVWESTVQNVLAAEEFPVAKAHFICTELSLLGGAFFIMDCIPGQLLMFAPSETVPGLLGRTHAELHQIDPNPLIKGLEAQGVEGYRYSLEARFNWLQEKAGRHPWIQDNLSWLIENRPPEPPRLSVCHGDFHPLNILVQDGVITGVLDWPGFAVTDPVYDIANTIVLTTIPGKHLSALMEGLPSVDWDLAADLYLSAYQAHNPLDLTHLAYYKVRRCLMALVEGAEGQEIWQHPGIIADLLDCIQGITGIQLSPPA